MRKVFVRCEDVLPVVACSASFVGTRMSVVHAAAVHAIDVHGYANNRRLRDRIRDMLKPVSDAEPHEGPKRR